MLATDGRCVHVIAELMDDVEYVVEKAVATEVRMKAKPRGPEG
jgi:hypothetical protein